MSDRLDKTLDEIIGTKRRTAGRGGRGRRVRPAQAGRVAPIAPVGGVKKAKQAKGAVKPVPTGPAGRSGEGKIIVSGLPKDVNEPMIKEYFAKQVGPIKRVEISYGPGGVSRGIANITFSRAELATKAVDECNGIPVDGKPIKVELIIDANRAKAIPPPKALSERVSQPKAQPKSAADTKKTGTSTRGKASRRGGRGGRAARPKKTAEELDSDMADYFNAGTTTAENEGAANGATQPASNGDANMEEML